MYAARSRRWRLRRKAKVAVDSVDERTVTRNGAPAEPVELPSAASPSLSPTYFRRLRKQQSNRSAGLPAMRLWDFDVCSPMLCSQTLSGESLAVDSLSLANRCDPLNDGVTSCVDRRHV